MYSLLQHGILVLIAFAASSAWACDKFVLVRPIPGSQMTELQPELVWAGNSEGSYRVQVAAVLPETRVILSIDVMTLGNRFKLPAPILSNFAAVKVLVSQNCTQLDAQDVNAQGPSFFVNTRAMCSLSSGTFRQNDGALVWDPINNATGYIVQLFEVESERDGAIHTTLLSTSQTISANWDIPTAAPGIRQDLASGLRRFRVATVQAVCNGLSGPAEQISLKLAG